jgi:oxalyl-CoA decarboxylase
MSAVVQSIDAQASEQELTDGFHLIIDALKLNDIKTIYGVPGIPITDFGRMAQAEGIRVLSFRHEQNAGYAAAIAGYLTKKPGVCLTVSAPGFLNGLTALAHATTNCFPMILISGSSEREIVDLQQGDYEEMDQLAIAKPLCKACCTPPVSALDWPARSVPRSRGVPAVSISICRRNCSARS